MKLGIGSLVAVSVIAALTFCGCAKKSSQSQAGKKLTIAFCFQDLETEFWVAGYNAITSTLKAKGYTVIEKNAGQDANKQLEQVRDLITQKVDGIILIPQDGQSALTIIGECNKAGVPIGIFNRPPADSSNKSLVVVADNEKIADAAVEYMAQQAKLLNRKVTPLILVGDLGDPNAVYRKKGFYKMGCEYRAGQPHQCHAGQSKSRFHFHLIGFSLPSDQVGTLIDEQMGKKR
jgi:ABC-type sugar transport system substrate-binding protein